MLASSSLAAVFRPCLSAAWLISSSQQSGLKQLPVLFSLMQQRQRQFSQHTSQAGSVSTSLPLERLQQAITPQVCAELGSRGYAVVDGVFGPSIITQLQQELEAVYNQGLMHLNHTHLVAKGTTTLLPKSQIHEAELTLDPAIQRAAPLIAQLNVDRTLATMLTLQLPQLRLESQAIKMQHNEGSGGCFPLHFDSDEQLDGRRVTAIIYLNSNWQPGFGGELRLYPFPAPPVDIAPIAGRMCLFASTSMLHRVLPSNQPRSCFTIWLSQGERRAHSAAVAGSAGVLPPPDAGSDSDAVWRFLMQPAVRQHVCKLAYADEWEQSIKQSHPQSDETEAALATHRQEVQRIETALKRYTQPIQQLLAASQTLADASTSEPGGGASKPSEQQLQEAVAVLRQAAAHVKWF